MFPIRTVLHPTDFSDRSDAAFGVAAALARDYGARLVVLHVAPNDVVYAGLIGAVRTDPRRYLEAIAARLAEYHADGLAAPIATHLVEGEVVAGILRAAAEVAADLIVLGSHGRSGLGRVLLGSVAEGVLRHAPCPVLTVKAPVPIAERAPLPAEEPAWVGVG
jgi:nucleotide-binding universal stress UspA family protein